MKFELAAMLHNDSITSILVETEYGVYSVNFDRCITCFEKDVKISDILVGDITLESEFTKAELIPKDGFDGVLCYPCGKCTIGRYSKSEIIMEYLDTSNGTIPYHNHPFGVMEVYLSVEPPFEGRICGIEEFHEPFCDHTIAVKIIRKTLI